MPNNKKLIVVVGPTAVGKTATSILLAKEFSTEIISADSRQIFRELNIGTAKPDEAELAQVKHHFINTHSLMDKYDAAQFGKDALELVEKLFRTHEYIVICGGSGLYIKALLEGFDDIPSVDEEIRKHLVDDYEKNGLGFIQKMMQDKDPEYWKIVDQQNPQRLLRALEVKLGTGNSILHYQKRSKAQHRFRIKQIGLELPRERLYERIDTRMDKMIADGLFEEAKMYFEMRHINALQTVGYQEIFGFIEGLYDREEAIRLLKRNSRRYAKRQLTWFKRDSEIRWFHPSATEHMINYIATKEPSVGG